MTLHITYDAARHLSWADAVNAIRAGHRLPRAEIADVFLGPDNGTLLSRAARIAGLGYGVKSVTVFGDNPSAGLPTVQGAMLVFEHSHGRLEAIIESRLITEYKTAADSVLGATLLARPDSAHLLIVGAGTVARSLIAAYPALFPSLKRITIWARRPEQAADLAATVTSTLPVSVATDLEAAVADADIISTATLSRDPVLRGAWVRPGTHVDLIGAFRKDMREADDTLMGRSSLYVDSRDTTIAHIGEILIPMAAGVIGPDSVRGDLYDLVADRCPRRQSADEVTVFKNGGGAHLDLMTARYIAATVEARSEPGAS